ncbi:2-oxoglutarate (2OG) and Fe(II)-dependent oxygenase superfamily protein [Striga asiatica]|uniref:2-oxoglutarate (2OG) and Fe(II)-dependent oxygenase superfamily protein n=1 Tax=Striga asiatica TaxID=4170 RepID=A0A5A7Q7U0_STRAF|nr:2-oxoglutarate (2OG) and Fe(II)-dependent oxygenase superfamily protein [Striga asiatica]
MDCGRTTTWLKGSWFHYLVRFTIWMYSFENVLPLPIQSDPSQFPSAFMLTSSPGSRSFEPIQISPAVIPRTPIPSADLPPMYPTYPSTYEPILTGRCPVNFSVISSVMEKTASDCTQPFAGVVANVICCPQLSSLLHIFKGFYSTDSDNLVLQNAAADDCFKDIVSILASRGANSSISTICSIRSSNLTGGSCPVKDVATFERTVNTSKLLDACSTIDPLKECCRPICNPVVMEAALNLSGVRSYMNDNMNAVGLSNPFDLVNDCKGVVFSWISRKLSRDSANSAFRILSACKVNKACPLELRQPSEVIAECLNVAAPSPSCCRSLNSYITGIQKQMLITNRQAILCATMLGHMLRKGGVMANVYELCDVDIKDFSLQGCLLPSLPADMVYDNSSGFSFHCDLTDNIEAPWPLSSSMTSMSLCAPEMSLPALPTSRNLGNPGAYSIKHY